jgi:NDP-sugar pyrophosphorylase family protein
MPVGERPILEIILRRLRAVGVTDVVFAVGYLASLLEAYFGDGSKFGLSIRYSPEPEPLGTAGPLGLIERMDEPFLVMNGDVLTDLDFGAMLRFHREQGGPLTVATYERAVNIDLGVLHTDLEGAVTDYIEKPTLNYTVSMGIYVMDPEVQDLVTRGQRKDLPELVLELLAAGRRVAAYRHGGHWLDIGRPDDYVLATEEFERDPERYLT